MYDISLLEQHQPYELLQIDLQPREPSPEKPLAIHTSDRISYRRCRRKWALSSPLRGNYGGTGSANIHLWFGSGFHFAMEDYYGHQRYETLENAFRAYYYATRFNHPTGASEYLALADGMFQHYRRWASKRSEFTTVWANGLPLVEVTFQVPIWDSHPDIVYGGTFDRVVVDPHDRIWIVDYKTAQRFDTSKLEKDPQVSAYLWAFEKLYGIRAEGLIYMQFLKAAPKAPVRCMDGTLSVNKNQATTYELFRDEVIKDYGNVVGRIPPKYLAYAQMLKDRETAEGDPFIRVDLVRRNDFHIATEEWKIKVETKEMVDPSLPIYPSPTRDCSWDCDFNALCVAMDDGSDARALLAEGYVKRGEITSWKANLPTPEQLRQLLNPEQPLSVPQGVQRAQPQLEEPPLQQAPLLQLPESSQ